MVEVVAHRGFQDAHVDHRIGAADPQILAEMADRGGRVAAPAQAAQGGQARVVPAVHMAFVHQQLETALAGHGEIQVEAGELVLARLRGDVRVLHQPVVQWPVILELQGAETVGDAFQRIRERMGEIVHRVDHPLVTGLVMRFFAYPVEHRIAHVQVGALHVDAGTQHRRAFVELVVAHVGEQRQVLFHGAVPVRAVTPWGGEVAAHLRDLLRRLGVHIGQALADQGHRQIVELVEIVAGEAHRAGPLEAEPFHVLLDGVDVLVLFLFRVGVVKAQMTGAAVGFGDAEIQANRLGVTDMQVAVRLRREPGHHPATVFSFGQVTIDDLSDKVTGRFCFTH